MGHLPIKTIDKKLAHQSPLGMATAKTNVKMMTAALVRRCALVSAQPPDGARLIRARTLQEKYERYLPESHPTIARLKRTLAEEHDKLGNTTEAKYLKAQAGRYARKGGRAGHDRPQGRWADDSLK